MQQQIRTEETNKRRDIPVESFFKEIHTASFHVPDVCLKEV